MTLTQMIYMMVAIMTDPDLDYGALIEVAKAFNDLPINVPPHIREITMIEKQSFIDNYILKFMATYDANHCALIIQCAMKRCSYTDAATMAEGAWLIYLEAQI